MRKRDALINFRGGLIRKLFVAFSILGENVCVWARLCVRVCVRNQIDDYILGM